MKSSAKIVLMIVMTIALSMTQSCVSESQEAQNTAPLYQSSESGLPCSSTRQECLGLINQHSSEIARIVRAQAQEQDPEVTDVLSSLYYASVLQSKEEEIKQNCPSAFEEYEMERNTLITLLIAREVIR
ncbi:hypothetical protein GCM10027592_56580 [Spirosoma flavus]